MVALKNYGAPLKVIIQYQCQSTSSKSILNPLYSLYGQYNPLPHNMILDRFELKAVADNKISEETNMGFVS